MKLESLKLWFLKKIQRSFLYNQYKSQRSNHQLQYMWINRSRNYDLRSTLESMKNTMKLLKNLQCCKKLLHLRLKLRQPKLLSIKMSPKLRFNNLPP